MLTRVQTGTSEQQSMHFTKQARCFLKERNALLIIGKVKLKMAASVCQHLSDPAYPLDHEQWHYSLDSALAKEQTMAKSFSFYAILTESHSHYFRPSENDFLSCDFKQLKGSFYHFMGNFKFPKVCFADITPPSLYTR